MAWIDLRLLGGFEARLKSGPALDLRTRKGELLLAYLALSPHKAFPRDKLTALLWSDRSDDQARHSLRQTLTVIRNELGGSEIQPFIADGDRIGLNAEAFDVDAVAFEHLIATGDHDDLAQACNLYRGDLLENASVRDEAFEEWLVLDRQRLHGLALRAFERLLAWQQQTSASDEIAITAQRLLKLESANEMAHRALMRLYADQGQREAALRQYQECRATLKRELNAEPGPETEQLYRSLLEGQVAARTQLISGLRATEEEQPAQSTQVVSGPAAARPLSRRRVAIAAGVLLLAVAGAIGVWYHNREAEPLVFDPLGTGKLELPDRPSIAVLPFENLSGDPGQSYIGDGIADDIITALSHLRGMMVIARNSSFTFRNNPTDVKTIGEKLGVRHVLEGSVQRSVDNLRITAQLVRADTREHVWAENYDRPAADILTVQDEIVSKIVTALNVKLVEGPQAQTWRLSTANPDAYDLFLRGRELSLFFRREELSQSFELLNEALKLDPNFAMAWVWQGWNHDILAWSGWSKSATDSYEQAIACAERALAIDPHQDAAHALLGEVYIVHRGDFEAGIHELELAAELNPNNAKTHALLALYLPYVGRSQEAFEHIQKAWRLSPFPDDWYFDALGAAYYGSGRYDEAIAAWNECRRRMPDYLWCRVTLTFAYMKTNRESKAHEVVKEVLRINPHFSSSEWAKVFADSEIALLRKAGLPE
jgi:TolB-like protein/DNA-binding SARP family transcriptional activator/Tfp pilus assembly protein PilF